MEGLAFNYLGFPRQEAIHLRGYAIFGGGEIANGSTEHRFPKYYDNIYPTQRDESLIQRHRFVLDRHRCLPILDACFARWEGGWSRRPSWRDNVLDGKRDFEFLSVV